MLAAMETPTSKTYAPMGVFMNMPLNQVSFMRNLRSAYISRLQTAARKAVSSGPRSHFVNDEKRYLRKIRLFGRI